MNSNDKFLYSEKLPFVGLNMVCILLFLGCIYEFIHNVINYDLITMIVNFLWIVLFLALAIHFYELKIRITKDFIEAKFGLYSKKVPIDSIRSIKIHKYRYKDYLGWGIRKGIDGSVAFNVWGDRFTGVYLIYDDAGQERKLFISSKNPANIIYKLKELRKDIKIGENV